MLRCCNALARPFARSPGLAPVWRTLSSYNPTEARKLAPNAPPGPEDRLGVLFPRATSHKASLEVKKRILYTVPHMGAKKLKLLVRKHSRRGTMESFIGEFESRLDKFIYRCNLVPSIFSARQMIGHGHIMINGKTVRRHSRLLTAHDIVEPHPKAVRSL